MDVVVLVSGRGSNLAALLGAIDAGTCAVRIAAVIADRPEAQALALAEQRGIATRVVAAKAFGDRTDWDQALAQAITDFRPGLVVLAGFMRIVGPAVLAGFSGRILNVHPALLPAFPGMDAPAQAVRAGVTLSGCTVHLVDAGVDTGPILAQAAVAVLPGDDASTLHARIQSAEHRLLPRVVHAVATGAYQLTPEVRYVGELSDSPAPFAWPTGLA